MIRGNRFTLEKKWTISDDENKQGEFVRFRG